MVLFSKEFQNLHCWLGCQLGTYRKCYLGFNQSRPKTVYANSKLKSSRSCHIKADWSFTSDLRKIKASTGFEERSLRCQTRRTRRIIDGSHNILSWSAHSNCSATGKMKDSSNERDFPMQFSECSFFYSCPPLMGKVFKSKFTFL